MKRRPYLVVAFIITLIILKQFYSSNQEEYFNLFNSNNVNIIPFWKQLSIINNNLVDQFEYVHSQRKKINYFLTENNETKVTEVYNIFKKEFIERSNHLINEMKKAVDLSPKNKHVNQLLNAIQLITTSTESLDLINQNEVNLNEVLDEIYFKQYKLISTETKSILNNIEINTIRKQKLEEKSNEIKQNINRLKNVKNCDQSRKLICEVRQSCGYLCQLHFLTVCFIQGYYTNRTVIFKDLDPKKTKKHESLIEFSSNINRFEQSYEKLSNCPLEENDIYDVEDHINLNCNAKTIRLIIERNYFGFAAQNTDYYPDKFIDDLNEMNNYINDPLAWMYGQFIKHVLIMNEETSKFVHKSIVDKQLQKSYIGFQIRRGDKVNDQSSFHSFDEYVNQIELYYDNKKDVINGFISTDEPSLIEESKNKKNYNFAYDKDNINSASKFAKEFNRETFLRLLVDVYTLSQADFVVCTFSSNVCRFVYELMQGQNGLIDPHYRIRSLDRHFYADSFNTFTKLAVLDHKPQNENEIEMKSGDIISIFCTEGSELINVGSLWNGYMKGTNLRTQKSGLFPSFKVQTFYTRTNSVPENSC